ncbi:NAD-dependent epimerase/dehydratase family protein [Sporosarcina beigongshangi]|uniref:NAD-dependent epimerase/dehydratase family protein n=1 Tax=Sporosarcina beigongshangi TaxID=2782538 RepID=UPI001939504E|nr:NAD-dependent epimerase/dehydratase family protein [Sporosarcina beigongshangi]
MKILVTGGAGFIGSHVIEELVNHQYEVVLVDNLVTGSLDNLLNMVKIYQFDINDPEIEYVFDKERPDYVIHLAAQVSVTASMNDPFFDLQANIVGTVKLISLAKKYNVKNFVFASSAAVYGEPNYLPIDENHRLHALSFYSLSKYSAEKYIELYDEKFGGNSCILRFSNVYGPRQNADGEAGVISIFIKKLVHGEDVEVFGGFQTRDFVYVKDVARACRLAIEGEHKGIYNICSGIEMSIEGLLAQVFEATGVTKTPIYQPIRVGEIERSVLDNRKITSSFDWRPRYSLPEGLRETVHYYSTVASSKLSMK